MNSLLNSVGDLLRQAIPNQSGLAAERIKNSVGKQRVRPLLERGASFNDGRLGRMDFQIDGNDGATFVARAYATGSLTGTMAALLMLVVRNADGSVFGTKWGDQVDTDREMLAILATGNGPIDLINRALMGSEGTPVDGSERTIRELYNSAQFINDDLVESLKFFSRDTAVCHLPNENTSARLWKKAGFTIEDYRKGEFFRTYKGE
jgi:hypothetical protein